MLRFLVEAVAKDPDGMVDALLRSLKRRELGSSGHNVRTSTLGERLALLSDLMTASSRSIGTGPILRSSPWSRRLDLI